MSNDCCGILKVAAKKKETLERLYKILKYEDDEYFVSGVKDVGMYEEPHEDGDFWVCDFSVDGKWNCIRFFDTDENKETHAVMDYEKNSEGNTDFNKPIYGKSYLTNLVLLAQRLDFGCELFSSEPGMCFCEHILVNHNGEYVYNETGEYEENYPKDENGEPLYDEGPEIVCGIEDFDEFSYADEIYGEGED